MLLNYTFENFASYKDECTVDFSVTKKTPHSYFDYETESGEKIAKVMSVFGPNGAGKSNLVKPIAFLSWFVVDSFGGSSKNAQIPFDPHKLREDENTKIELEFIVPKWNDLDEYYDQDIQFKYAIELNRSRVFKEILKVKTSRLYSTVFDRMYDSNKNAYTVKTNKKISPDIPLSLLNQAPKNCSLLSYIYALQDEDKTAVKDNEKFAITKMVHGYFQFCFTNLTQTGRASLSGRIESAVIFFQNNEKQFKFAKELIRGYDMGIDDIVLQDVILVNNESGKEQEKTIPYCVHNKGSDDEFKLPIFMESSGTNSAFCVLALICEILSTGGLAILDEFDNDFHPELTLAILNLFKDQESNPRNSQLIFNTHTTEVLKTLKRQHTYLVEKQNGSSDAYRASDIEGLKDRDSLYKKYISGALGAIPEIIS